MTLCSVHILPLFLIMICFDALIEQRRLEKATGDIMMKTQYMDSTFTRSSPSVFTLVFLFLFSHLLVTKPLFSSTPSRCVVDSTT